MAQGQMVPQGAGNRAVAGGPPSGSQGALRRRPSAAKGGSAGRGGVRSSVANFYTDESPGIKFQPAVVIVMSLGFIAFVTVLHIIGSPQHLRISIGVLHVGTPWRGGSRMVVTAVALLALLAGSAAAAAASLEGAGGLGRSLQQVVIGAADLSQQQQSQQQALLLLKSSLDSAGTGALADWQSSTSPCSFSGVSCNSQGLVTGINLASAGLTGSLPLDNSVWEPLASLQSLNLADNSIGGYVPPQFADLTNLQSVQLQNNQLQGPLPNLSTSTSLQSANVAGNQLTGCCRAAVSRINTPFQPCNQWQRAHGHDWQSAPRQHWDPFIPLTVLPWNTAGIAGSWDLTCWRLQPTCHCRRPHHLSCRDDCFIATWEQPQSYSQCGTWSVTLTTFIASHCGAWSFTLTQHLTLATSIPLSTSIARCQYQSCHITFNSQAPTCKSNAATSLSSPQLIAITQHHDCACSDCRRHTCSRLHLCSLCLSVLRSTAPPSTSASPATTGSPAATTRAPTTAATTAPPSTSTSRAVTVSPAATTPAPTARNSTLNSTLLAGALLGSGASLALANATAVARPPAGANATTGNTTLSLNQLAGALQGQNASQALANSTATQAPAGVNATANNATLSRQQLTGVLQGQNASQALANGTAAQAPAGANATANNATLSPQQLTGVLQGQNASQALANSTSNTTAAPASTANSTSTVTSLSIRNETTNSTLPLDQLNSTLSSSAQNTSLLLAASSGAAAALTALSSGGNVTVPVEDLNAVLAGSGGTINGTGNGGISTGAGSNATGLLAAPAGTNVTLSLAQLGQMANTSGQTGAAVNMTGLSMTQLTDALRNGSVFVSAQSANGSQAVAPVTTGTNRTLTLAQFNQALSNGSASGQPATAESLSNSTLALAMVNAALLNTTVGAQLAAVGLNASNGTLTANQLAAVLYNTTIGAQLSNATAAALSQSQSQNLTAAQLNTLLRNTSIGGQLANATADAGDSNQTLSAAQLNAALQNTTLGPELARSLNASGASNTTLSATQLQAALANTSIGGELANATAVAAVTNQTLSVTQLRSALANTSLAEQLNNATAAAGMTNATLSAAQLNMLLSNTSVGPQLAAGLQTLNSNSTLSLGQLEGLLSGGGLAAALAAAALSARSLAPELAPELAPALSAYLAPALGPATELAPELGPALSAYLAPAPGPATELALIGTPGSAPLLAPGIAPELAPLPAPEVAPASAPEVAPGVAPGVAAGIVPGAAANAEAPGPGGPITNGFPVRLAVTGLDRSIDQTAFQNATLQQEYDSALANAAGVPVSQVNSSFNSASMVQITNGTTGRRLLQSGGAVSVDSFLFSNNRTGSQQNFNNAVQNGQLGSALNSIGLSLVNADTAPTGSAAPVSQNVAPPPSSPVTGARTASSTGGTHNLALKIALPVALGVALALAIVLCCCCFLYRRRRHRAREARRTQAEGALYSHKANPVYDTNQTLTSSASSARGDDFEVIRVPPGYTNGAQPAAPGSSRPMPRFGSPPVSDRGLQSGSSQGTSLPTERELQELYSRGSSADRDSGKTTDSRERELRSLGLTPGVSQRGASPASARLGAAGLGAAGLGALQPIGREDSFNSAASDGRGSYRSAGSGGDYMSARGSLQPGIGGERFGSPRGSYGSGSYASAREFGSRQASMEPDMFDAISRDDSFTYNMPPYGPAGMAGPIGPWGPRDQTNPLFGADLMRSREGYQNNPAFDSMDSTRMRDRMGRDPIELTEFAAPGTGGAHSVQGYPLALEGSTMGSDYGSQVGSRQGSPRRSRSLEMHGYGGRQGSPHSMRAHPVSFSEGGSEIMGSNPSVQGHRLNLSGSEIGSQMGSVLGSPPPSRYGSYELQHAPVQEESLMGTEGSANLTSSGAETNAPTGTRTNQESSNPMYSSGIMDTQDSEAGRNPLWESQSMMEPQGGAANPLYGSQSDIMASRDSMGAERNPLWESTGEQSPQGGEANPLFGSDILDTTESLTGERNPVWESAPRRPAQGQGAGPSTEGRSMV
eukprot:jgi/Astpho2/6163/fgenesh1_pg.00088_%23_8_t